MGVLVGGATAVKAYSCVKITSGGVFLMCKGLEWSFASIKVAEFSFGAIYASTSSVAAAAQHLARLF